MDSARYVILFIDGGKRRDVLDGWEHDVAGIRLAPFRAGGGKAQMEARITCGPTAQDCRRRLYRKLR